MSTRSASSPYGVARPASSRHRHAPRDRPRLSFVKILVVHNRYQHAGGEDQVFAAECRLLRDGGHDVHEYVRSNDDIATAGPAARVRLAAGTVWARAEQRSLRDVIRRVAPDVAHFHNTFP